MPGPSSETVATISTKSAKRQQSGPAFTVTLVSLRGGGVPSSGRSKRRPRPPTPKWGGQSPSLGVNRDQHSLLIPMPAASS
jgi:hypothetical protein